MFTGTPFTSVTPVKLPPSVPKIVAVSISFS